MTTKTSSNGQAASATDQNESRHYTEAERWLAKAEQRYDGCTLDMTWQPADEAFVDRCLRFAAVHAQLAQAADIDRSAEAQSRLSRAVPEEGSALRVAPVGR